MVVSLAAIHLSLGFLNVYHSTCVWPTALKLGYIANFDMFFLVMGLISLVDEIQFMLISNRHTCLTLFYKITSIHSFILLYFLPASFMGHMLHVHFTYSPSA